MKTLTDISPRFYPRGYDQYVARQLVKREATPEAIEYFASHCDRLTDYGYWFLLSTLWVSYTGFSDLGLWKRLLASDRPNREECIMKPSELEAYRNLPETVLGYRAHRPNERDWLSYTLDLTTACRFAHERGVEEIALYRIPRSAVVALFLRRSEYEILVLDRSSVELEGKIPLRYATDSADATGLVVTI